MFVMTKQLGFMLLTAFWKFNFPPFMVLVIAILNDGKGSHTSCTFHNFERLLIIYSSSIFVYLLNHHKLFTGTIMTISKDRVKPSPLPDSWKLSEIFATGIVIGSYLALMTALFFYLTFETSFFAVLAPCYVYAQLG